MHQINPVFHDVQSLRSITGRPVLGAISLTWQDRYQSNRKRHMTSFSMAGAALIGLFVVSIVFQEQVTDLVRAVLTSSPA